MHTEGRKAIAMIELIFAIVIIGITLMSAPMLIDRASQSAYTSISQESVAAGAAEISMILARAWDENNTGISTGAPILNVTSGDPDLNAANRANIYPTNPLSTRSYINNLGGTNLKASIALGPDSSDFDDIDDKNGLPPIGLEDNQTTTQEGDLIDTSITIQTTVSYLNDTASWTNNTISYSPAGGSPSTNIKLVEITLTSMDAGTTPELEKTIKFKAFSSNIGTYKLKRKELWP